MVPPVSNMKTTSISPIDFPFSYAETTDHITENTDAILKRPETDPLLFHSQTATEYWQRHGSLVHTDTQGKIKSFPKMYAFMPWSAPNILLTQNKESRPKESCKTSTTWPAHRCFSAPSWMPWMLGPPKERRRRQVHADQKRRHAGLL